MISSTAAIVVRNTFTPFNGVNAAVIAVMAWAASTHQDNRLVLDAVGISTVVIANTAIACFQEWRAYRALQRITLRTRSAQPPAVGEEVEITRGMVVEADGIVLWTEECEVDSSIVTGETEPHALREGHEVLDGMVCVSGRARYRVTRSGQHTTTAAVERESRTLSLSHSPIQRGVNRVFVWSFFVAACVAVLDVLTHTTPFLNNVDAIRRVATLVLGLIPEGLVLFSTVTMVMGAARMARHGVLVQRISALDTLARANVVCMDKTGTLTQNQLVLTAVVPLGKESELACRGLVGSYAASMSSAEGTLILALQGQLHSAAPLQVAKRTPFSSSRRMSSITTVDGTEFVLSSVPEHLRTTLEENGLAHLRTLYFEVNGEPTCLLGFTDPLKPESHELMQHFSDCGIRPVLLTGDNEQTARSVVRDLKMPKVDIVANATPETKKIFLSNLKESNVVVMVGDGVNDLPAMRSADVGVAVSNASPATKRIADVVLEDTNLAVFPLMFEYGRVATQTVFVMTALFLSKSVVLIGNSVATIAGWAEYPWTPRRGALLSLVAVALPSTIMATTGWIRPTTVRFFSALARRVPLIGGAALAASITSDAVINGGGLGDASLYAVLSAMITAFVLSPELQKNRRTLLVTIGVLTVMALIAIPSVSNMPSVLPIAAFFEIQNIELELAGRVSASLIGAVYSMIAAVLLSSKSNQR